MSTKAFPDQGKSETSHLETDLEQDKQIVLPELPQDLLPAILRRLTPTERHQAFTQSILEIAWLPKLVLHAGIGKVESLQAPGQHLVATLSRPVFLDAVRRVLGRRLRLEATESLRQKFPTYSAARRTSPEQALFLVASSLAMVALALLVPRSGLTLSVAILFNLFFLLTLSLKLLWLTSVEPRRRAKALPPLEDAALPTYTVLVPVFHEAGILRQLIRALSALDYPDLCSSLT